METDNNSQTKNPLNNNSEFEPFTEEFDKEMVVNKENSKTPKKELSDEELVEILEMTEEIRKGKGFRQLIKGDPEELENTNEEVLQKRFKDYLQLKNIAGKQSGLPHSSRIPSEQIQDTNQTMEILDDPSTHENSKHSSVFVHKNENGDIEVIEVACSCGKKTFISLLTTETEKESEYPDIGIHEFNYEELKEKEGEEK